MSRSALLSGTTPLTWSSIAYFAFRGATFKTKEFGWRVGRLDTGVQGAWLPASCEQEFLERESTTEHWKQLVKDQYRQESITLNLKRGIAIRKENLKQHNYYSQLMTDELKDIEILPDAYY
ncbi:hypothetical protein KI688_004259 [Linnemannia hyalina]|uniref:Uncharacterized protein n=1 Tax=Linnemannia hyalina TaxID=64524 RepID=A0A9P7XM09_9FUNG|nr:hypothetical protein KI688_004259 [Linnemannia hyalina]